MNKTRFYEITQAYRNGDNLDDFVPSNAAEAELIANLKIGAPEPGILNIAEFDNRVSETGQPIGGSTTAGIGQVILEAFKAGVKLVRIEDFDSHGSGTGTRYSNVVSVVDIDDIITVVCATIDMNENSQLEATLTPYVYAK